MQYYTIVESIDDGLPRDTCWSCKIFNQYSTVQLYIGGSLVFGIFIYHMIYNIQYTILNRVFQSVKEFFRLINPLEHMSIFRTLQLRYNKVKHDFKRTVSVIMLPVTIFRNMCYYITTGLTFNRR